MRINKNNPDKLAIIIDHVGNCFEHGLPDDTRNWTLKGKIKKSNEEKIRECPQCFAVIEPKIKFCPYCNYSFQKEIDELQKKQEKQLIEMELKEIEKKDIWKSKSFHFINKLNTLKDILSFVELKNYKPGVIYHQISTRPDIKITEDDLKQWQKLAGYKNKWWTHQTHLINQEV